MLTAEGSPRTDGTIPEDPLNRIDMLRPVLERQKEKSFAPDLQRLKQLYGAREGYYLDLPHLLIGKHCAQKRIVLKARH